jgi:hypothetical protein
VFVSYLFSFGFLDFLLGKAERPAKTRHVFSSRGNPPQHLGFVGQDSCSQAKLPYQALAGVAARFFIVAVKKGDFRKRS